MERTENSASAKDDPEGCNPARQQAQKRRGNRNSRHEEPLRYRKAGPSKSVGQRIQSHGQRLILRYAGTDHRPQGEAVGHYVEHTGARYSHLPRAHQEIASGSRWMRQRCQGPPPSQTEETRQQHGMGTRLKERRYRGRRLPGPGKIGLSAKSLSRLAKNQAFLRPADNSGVALLFLRSLCCRRRRNARNQGLNRG